MPTSNDVEAAASAGGGMWAGVGAKCDEVCAILDQDLSGRGQTIAQTNQLVAVADANVGDKFVVALDGDAHRRRRRGVVVAERCRKDEAKLEHRRAHVAAPIESGQEDAVVPSIDRPLNQIGQRAGKRRRRGRRECDGARQLHGNDCVMDEIQEKNNSFYRLL